jgi:nucleoside-diphosphate-sugar epimerase
MSQSLIFITGATGFIGAHVASQALSAGYRLRISIRKEAQIDALRTLYSKYADQLDFVVIPDLSSPDAFASALQDVTYVFHLASPLPGGGGSDFEKDYLQPAVKGTTTLLDAAQNFPTIKRVIVTSSAIALIPMGALFSTEPIVSKGMVFPLSLSLKTSTNTHTEGINRSLAVDPKMSFPEEPMANAGLKYQASKILAHRATLDWAAAHNPSFNVISLHPSFVFGRSLTDPRSVSSNDYLWHSLTSPQPVIPLAPVDVQDVAEAHVKALSADVGPTGEVAEFLLNASEREGWSWDAVARFAKEKFPSVEVLLEGPYGVTPQFETARAETLLGMKWRDMQDTVGSYLEQIVELKGKA